VLPFALLPLLSPYTLLAAPALAINLLSSFDGQRNFLNHYNSLIVAVLAVAVLDGARKLVGWASARSLRAPPPEPQRGKVDAPSAGAVAARPFALRRPSVLAVGLTALLLAAALLSQGVTELRRNNVDYAAARDLGQAQRVAYLLSHIPQGARVSAQSQFHPHLSHRQQIFIYPNPFITADFYNPQAQPFTPEIDYVAIDTRRLVNDTVSAADKRRLARELEERGLYRRAAELGGLLLLERVPGWPEGCYGPGWAGEECGQ
jgi:uncharacterized membrane protein